MGVIEPRYNEVLNTTIETLLMSTSNILPIDIKTICKEKNLGTISYSNVINSLGVNDNTFELLMERTNGFGVEITDKYDNGYFCIVYNDSQIETRQRFTIAHELGHYMLGHYSMGYNPLKHEEQYSIFEQEANYFARMILAPFPILSNLDTIYQINTNLELCVEDISSTFHISKEAASNVLNHYNAWRNSFTFNYCTQKPENKMLARKYEESIIDNAKDLTLYFKMHFLANEEEFKMPQVSKQI